jgi:integrative and conjugative element protein (TIGR02256 family)
MEIVLAPQVIKRLKRELRRAGRQEIGGLLMGEHVRDELFRVLDISVQRFGGNEACFIRNPSDHHAQLQKFFSETGGDYTHFNYLGEWHSHPSFAAIPSVTDVQTMQSIIDDPAVGANFLVLLVVKLSGKQTEATALAFRASTQPVSVLIVAKQDSPTPPEGVLYRWFSRIFRS